MAYLWKCKVYKTTRGDYVVAERRDDGRYYAPMNAWEKKATGCHTAFANNIDALGVHTYKSKSAAKRWAVSQEIEIED